MASMATDFVSKRFERAAFAGLCLIAVQLLLVVAACHAEPTPMAARAAPMTVAAN